MQHTKKENEGQAEKILSGQDLPSALADEAIIRRPDPQGTLITPPYSDLQ